MQVGSDENSAAIRKALSEGGNRHSTIVTLRGLNHLLQAAHTGSPSEYQQIAETMSPLALETISDWIALQLRQPAGPAK